MKNPTTQACYPMALLALTATACATGGTSSSSPDRCRSDLATSVESLEAVLDSAAAQRGVEVLWPDEAGMVLASVRAESSDVTDPVQVYSESLTPDQEEGMAEVLHQTSRLLFGSDARGYLVLGDENGPALRRVEPFARCAPAIISREPISRRIAAESRGLNIDQPMAVRLYVFVEATGTVGDVRIDESSGDVNVDLAAVRVFQGERFVPGMIEGMPLPTWVSFPVTFRPR